MSRNVAVLRHAMVRMLYDPGFVAQIHAGGAPGLDAEELALLRAIDRRAWSTDRYRRSRSVQALIEEYPVTTAVLGIAAVDSFFSSDAFGRVLSRRGSLALDFGSWAQARGGSVVRLERAIAVARREQRPAGPGLVTKPGVEPLFLPAGVLDFYVDERKALGHDPVATLARRRTRAPRPVAGEGQDALLLEKDSAGQVQVGGASASLVTLLSFMTTPRTRAATLAHARRLGCAPGEDAETVDELLAERLLIERP